VKYKFREKGKKKLCTDLRYQADVFLGGEKKPIKISNQSVFERMFSRT